MGTRIAVVGGGVAGSMLALRLAEQGAHVDLYRDPATSGMDATGASGGFVRGFETDLDQCRLAAASLAELRGDPMLARACGYRETRSSYFLRPDADPQPQLAVLDAAVAGSARVVPAAELARTLDLGPRPDGTVAVVERYAGYVDPDAMRRYAAARAADLGARVRDEPVAAVQAVPASDAGPAVTLVGGTVRRHDAVVVAAGAWTGRLLPVPLRTRRIQYGVYPLARPDLGCLVDDLSTLYGRSYGDGAVLLGVATSAWGVAPGDIAADPVCVERVSDVARTVLGLAGPLPPPRRVTAATECFAADGGLRLRAVAGMPGVYSFTGGAGGAAKSVLASSRLAATALGAAMSGQSPSFFASPPVLTCPVQGADTAWG
ncbi:MAG TPA: FAD-binding oxidoreductase [Micromonosporaceae bacterium]